MIDALLRCIGELGDVIGDKSITGPITGVCANELLEACKDDPARMERAWHEKTSLVRPAPRLLSKTFVPQKAP
jgi:hypothetical protein